MPSSATHIEDAFAIPEPTPPAPTHISQLLRMKTNDSMTSYNPKTNGAVSSGFGTSSDGDFLRAMPTRVEVEEDLAFTSTRYDDMQPVPLGPLEPNSTLASRVQTRMGREIGGDAGDAKPTNGHINGNGIGKRPPTPTSSTTGGKFGKLRKQLSRFTLGSGGIGESGRVAF
jgi:hypothetical protein